MKRFEEASNADLGEMHFVQPELDDMRLEGMEVDPDGGGRGLDRDGGEAGREAKSTGGEMRRDPRTGDPRAIRAQRALEGGLSPGAGLALDHLAAPA
jgi:hypothetical protein